MTSQVVICLGLLALLALYAPGPVAGHHDWICKDKFETCTPAAGDCCHGMMCKPGAAGRWNCMDSDLGEGIGKRSGCKRRGQYCEPSLNSGCCPGLRYRSKANFPRVHECC
ncbi:hypothetical protein RRG08_017687 [Elysia crispata]|uniref:Uncharacterized protein n=1 Tax=Elysia crispata TaxID=231223 RepID=A0AAE0YXE8_9GAST|nr:hypothetical protein RRG08_017687 [Elysia crispata]